MQVELSKKETRLISTALTTHAAKLAKYKAFKNQVKEALALAKWFKGI